MEETEFYNNRLADDKWKYMMSIKPRNLPIHPISDQFELRLGGQVDDGPVDTLNFRTHSRSEEWKQNVLSNTAIESSTFAELKPGKHTHKLYAMDPGFILDRIEIDMGGLPEHYGIIEEAKLDG